MAVKIRFARLGCKNLPFYRIVAADDKSRRNGKQIDVLGYWLSVGAQPTDPVECILFRASLLPPRDMVVISKKNRLPNLPVEP